MFIVSKTPAPTYRLMMCCLCSLPSATNSQQHPDLLIVEGSIVMGYRTSVLNETTGTGREEDHHVSHRERNQSKPSPHNMLWLSPDDMLTATIMRCR